MSDAVKQHWDAPGTVSMYDKLWAAQERRLMLQVMNEHETVLDVGCGEGEGLAEYATEFRRTRFIGVDYSAPQLARARSRCVGLPNVSLIQAAWPSSDEPRIPISVGCVMSTRFLINIVDMIQQRTALLAMVARVAPEGSLLLMEGSQEGHDELNAVRLSLGLQPLPVAHHNLFLRDDLVESTLERAGMQLCGKLGFGAFFLATRGIQPYFTPDAKWNSPFNIAAASPEFQRQIGGPSTQFSRIRLWVYRKPA
jgi:SAM-dependent methyltransferase